MGDWVKLTAQDGNELSAYVAKPAGEAVGAVVVVQEIFGVNDYIRRTVDKFANDGFVAIAPALFDRYEKAVELRYEGEDQQKAYGLYGKLSPETALLDLAAAFEHVKATGSTSVVGYCYGGLMSWLSATRGKAIGMAPACCVGYYAGGIGSVATEEPSCPVLLHFGGDDSHIGQEQINAVRAAHDKHKGEVEIFVYEGAGHGFSCDARASYNPEAAGLAWTRTLAFLKACTAPERVHLMYGERRGQARFSAPGVLF